MIHLAGDGKRHVLDLTGVPSGGLLELSDQPRDHLDRVRFFDAGIGQRVEGRAGTGDDLQAAVVIGRYATANMGAANVEAHEHALVLLTVRSMRPPVVESGETFFWQRVSALKSACQPIADNR